MIFLLACTGTVAGTAPFQLVQVAEKPVVTAIVTPPKGPDIPWLASVPGQLWILGASKPALDISDHMNSGGEMGLLGLAFHPSWPDDPRLFINYTYLDADKKLWTRISSFRVKSTLQDVDPTSEVEILNFRQPYQNHNSGALDFGPDGMLYAAIGDGGSGGDPHGTGQDRSDLLGSILRIDVSSAPYKVPADNPFVGQADVRPEIWLYGVRNPSSISFDSQTGDLVVADTGQAAWEEVNVLPNTGPNPRGRGANLGWSRMEGTQTFNGTEPTGHVPPTFAYEHLDAPDPAPTPGHIAGCSIVGGGVYRGTLLPSLTGRYVFGDACTGTMSAVLPDGSSPVTDLATIYHSDIWNDPVESCVVILTFDEDDDSLVIGGGDGSVSRVVAAP